MGTGLDWIGGGGWRRDEAGEDEDVGKCKVQVQQEWPDEWGCNAYVTTYLGTSLPLSASQPASRTLLSSRDGMGWDEMGGTSAIRSQV
jgi:hypothetical protein